MKILLFIILSILTSSCSSIPKGEKFSGLQAISKNNGSLYVYRPDKFAMKLAYPSIYIEGVPVADLLNGSYYFSELSPGTHSIIIKKNPESPKFTDWSMGPIEINLQVESGKEYFIKIVPFVGACGASYNTICISTSSQAYLVEKAIAETELLETTKLKAK